MFAGIQFHYDRHGKKHRSLPPPTYGQVLSGSIKGVNVLLLRPLEWTQYETWPSKPLQVLYLPTFMNVSQFVISWRGLQLNDGAWAAQCWSVECMTPALARERANPPKPVGAIPPSVPPPPGGYPPAPDPDNPFR